MLARVLPLALAVGFALPTAPTAPAAPADASVAAAAAAAKPRCHGLVATVVGTARNDRLAGTPGRDVIVGLGGDDRIYGLGGDDVICAGAGNDKVLAGSGDDWVDGGGGRDVLDGQTGDDVLWAGGGRRELLIGGRGQDHLILDSDRSHALAGTGKDIVDVYGRGSSVEAGPGNDLVRGGPGDDVIDGEDGDDVLRGNAGNDLIDGGQGRDNCDGGAGRDVCDGGAPGTAANTPTDPDRCVAETRVSCRSAGPRTYFAKAGGTLTYSEGVVETWTASFTLAARPDAERTLEGPATMTWKISGTDERGCTYLGSSDLAGRASYTLWPEFGYYNGQVYPDRDQQVDVQITCPDTGTTTAALTPLDGDAANTGNATLYADRTWLSDTRTYHPRNDPSVTAAWSWDAR